jgi:hypothetical protein
MKGFKVPFRQAKVLKILKSNRSSETVLSKYENKEGNSYKIFFFCLNTQIVYFKNRFKNGTQLFNAFFTS